jgi:hypothetical protein
VVAGNGSGWTDFITDFMTYTEEAISTDLHRRWAAIACLAGALERRVWVRVGSERRAYPNLYTVFVAPPGSGKFVINTVKTLWAETLELGSAERPAFRVAADSMTHASLIDDLLAAKCSRITPSGIITYHSLLAAPEEFEVLMPAYDPLFISRLNDLWNNKDSHRETRRHGPSRDVIITNPTLNILAGTTPAYFTAHFPDEAWNTGLIRRIIMVYSQEAPIKDIFLETPEQDALFELLKSRLSQVGNLFGEATLTEDARDAIRDWHMGGQEPKPTHSKLAYYCASRTHFILKLSLVSAVSRCGLPFISLVDAKRAFHWLFEVEALMPDIFRAMVGRSDAQVIEELWYFLHRLWNQNKQKPLLTRDIKSFLGSRLPSEKVPHVLQLAEGMDVIARVAGTEDLWVPRPKMIHTTVE